jgi:aminomethyltransferase
MSFSIAIGPREFKSPFFDASVRAGASAFTIYNHTYMPTSYGDPEGEYWRLIEAVSLWDVAAERQVEIAGPDAEAMVRYLLPRDISRTAIGQGRYVPMCDHEGRLINDPVLLKVEEGRYWLSIADADVQLWARAIAAERGFAVTIRDPGAAPLAVQGPKARALVRELFGDWVLALKYFWFEPARLGDIEVIVARSGWSKQGGFEIYLLDPERGTELWDAVFEAGQPYGIGPGAPNYIERVESALLSIGADTDDETNPFEVGLGRFVDLDRADDFIGKAALTHLETRRRRRMVGLFIEGAPLSPNQHPWKVTCEGQRVGAVRAAAFSPRLQRNIAMTMLDIALTVEGTGVEVETESGPRQGVVTTLPFVTPPVVSPVLADETSTATGLGDGI